MQFTLHSSVPLKTSGKFAKITFLKLTRIQAPDISLKLFTSFGQGNVSPFPQNKNNSTASSKKPSFSNTASPLLLIKLETSQRLQKAGRKQEDGELHLGALLEDASISTRSYPEDCVLSNPAWSAGHKSFRPRIENAFRIIS